MSFNGFLKQSTNTIVGYGPFVASADGETAQTALTINQVDVIIRKAGGTTWAQKAATGGATAVASGFYMVNIGTGDSGTVGILDVFSHVSPALYVKQSYAVLPGQVYDSLIGGTDFFHADVHQISGVNAPTLIDVATSSRVAGTATSLTNLDVTVSSRQAATAAVYSKLDVNVSSRAAATAAELVRIDVNSSSRVAATAATWGNLDATISSVYTKASGAATELGVGNIDNKISSRAAATAASLSNLDVLVSSRLAGTATVSASFATATQVTDKTGYTATVSDKTGFELTAAYDLAKTAAQASAVESVLQKTDVAISSRLAATGTFAQASAVSILATSAVQQQVSASATDIWDWSRGNWTVDPVASAMSAFRSDGVTTLWTYSLSAASNATAVPAFIKRTRA